MRKRSRKPKKGSSVKRTSRKPVTVAVSGGFDPIHIGHARMFERAKKLGDRLVVILNNDNWLKRKKGYAFMPEDQRLELIRHIRWVDEVVLTSHPPEPEDMSVCADLAKLKPDIFANGGDRTVGNVPEMAVCEEHGIEMVYGVGEGGKIQSSSWLLAAYMNEAPCPCGNGKKWKECGMMNADGHRTKTRRK